MVFNGFQKLTLLDYPGRIACTLFTAGCNFRCPFCHNASLVTHISNEINYSQDEILSYLQKRKDILEGVCITGGEPMLHNDLESFIIKIKELGYSVKLDTNGSFPDKLEKLVDNSLIDYVAMDIKNCKEKYEQTIGINNYDLADIEESIKFLLQNKINYEFRTTIVKEFHSIQDVENIAKWISGAPRYFLQNFIDSGDLIGQNLSSVEAKELEAMKNVATKYVFNTQIRGI